MAATLSLCGLISHWSTMWVVVEWLVRWSLPPQVPAGSTGTPWSSSSGDGLALCWARLPEKGGLCLDDISLLWFGLGPSGLLVGPSNNFVSCTLSWVGASILISCLCTVRATDPGFVQPTPLFPCNTHKEDLIRLTESCHTISRICIEYSQIRFISHA